ncbi:lipid II flippase MurJ [Treponema sp. R6D11]
MSKSAAKKAVFTIAFMFLMLAFAKVLGFLRNIFVQRVYGGNVGITETFYAALRIPTTFFDLALGAAVFSAFIPIFNEYKQKDGQKRAFEFANTFYITLVILSAILCAVLLCASPLIARMYPELSSVFLIKLLFISLPTIIFTTLAFISVAVLQSLDEYIVPAIISVISNAVIILFLIIIPFFNIALDKSIFMLCGVFLLGWALQFFVQAPFLYKKGFRFTFKADLKDEGLKKSAKLVVPILISSWVQPIMIFINTIFAASLFGGITSVENANALYIMSVLAITTAITNYIFPKLSQNVADNKDNSGMIKTSLLTIISILTPLMIITMIFAPFVAKLLYSRTQTPPEVVANIGVALRFYSIGMLSLGINEVLNKVFYAKKNGKTPMISSILGIASGIILCFIFKATGMLSISTIALSASISTNIIMIYLLIAYFGEKEKRLV